MEKNNDGSTNTLEFNQDGTGSFRGGISLYDFDWTASDGVVVLKYTSFEGEAHYDLVEEENGFVLVNQTNSEDAYVQESGYSQPLVYFEECASLPTADSCVDVYQSGKTTRSSNGVTTKITYRYSANSSEADLASLFNAYLEAVKASNLIPEEISETEYTITENGMIIASVLLDSGSAIVVDIVPESERVMSSSNAIPIAIGDTIQTKYFDFTLNNVELTYELKPQNTSGFYTSYTAENGKVYIHIDGTYTNTSKKDVCIRDLFIPHADYNNGYVYDGFVVIDDGDNGFDWVDSYIACTPLESCHYHGLIECPETVDESDFPLFITFSVDDGTTYRFDIR